MIKLDLVKAVIELNNLHILNPAQSFQCIKEIIEKTTQGTNKNFDKNTGEFVIKEDEEEKVMEKKKEMGQ